MPRQIFNITSLEEIERVRAAILNNEDFKLGEIKPITYMIKLDGGRFAEHHAAVIDADIAKVIVSHQENYSKLINELERNFEIQFNDEDKVLQFRLQDGCLEMISDLLGMEGLKRMESKHLMYVVLGISLMWFSHSAFNISVESELEKVKTQSEIKLKELEAADKQEERENYKQIIDKILEKDKEVSLNKNLQNAINKPKQVTVSILKDDEHVKFDNSVLTKESEPAFDYQEPAVDDIEEEPTINIYTLEYFNFVKEGKPFKIQGISPLANSAMLPADKRMRLMAKAELKEQVKLKVKIIKDGVTKRAKEAYILDFIEN